MPPPRTPATSLGAPQHRLAANRGLCAAACQPSIAAIHPLAPSRFPHSANRTAAFVQSGLCDVGHQPAANAAPPTSHNPPDAQIAAGVIQGGVEDLACFSGQIAEDYSAKELRGLARRSKDVNQSRRLLSLTECRDGIDRATRRRSAVWTARPCVTGSIASMLPVRMVCSTTDRRPQASPFGGATGSVRADRRGWSRS